MNTAFANLREKAKGPIGIVVLCLFVALVSSLLTYSFVTEHYNSEFSVFYSLDQKQNDKEIIKVIDGADLYVYFAIYYFTKENIADALIRAHNRGLVVWGIIDKESSVGASKNIVDKLRGAGVTIQTQKRDEGIMHIKAVVTDKAYASGSYNWTASATTANDEVLEVGTNRAMHKKYSLIIKKLLINNE